MCRYHFVFFFFFQAEDGIRDAQESRGLGDVYKRQVPTLILLPNHPVFPHPLSIAILRPLASLCPFGLLFPFTIPFPFLLGLGLACLPLGRLWRPFWFMDLILADRRESLDRGASHDWLEFKRGHVRVEAERVRIRVQAGSWCLRLARRIFGRIRHCLICAHRVRNLCLLFYGGGATAPVLCVDTTCLLYTSDAADEEDSVDLGGRRIIKKKKKI
eukprot:TRINITY_DN23566_c0_g1_i1.p1 TRINITY_DN23566_c0_g1~~TRINITY_DN23566_c0_g1_i1.p1  ORF type:complete len:215 (-),score=51.12 TRINITY_DN23566_c0_g1_i1:74-718(-)